MSRLDVAEKLGETRRLDPSGRSSQDRSSNLRQRKPDEMNEAARAAAPAKRIKGATGAWEVVVGMEVHAQVTSEAKLFSTSKSFRR